MTTHKRLEGLTGKKRRFAKRFLTMLALIFLLSGLWKVGVPVMKTRAAFSQRPSPLTATYDLHDLGVVDANQDGYLDVFTTNHSARQNLLLGSDSGRFSETLSPWNLDQDRTFAALEDTDSAPDFDRPGLYLYRQNFDLHLKITEDADGPVFGRLTLALPVEATQQDRFKAQIAEEKGADGHSQTVVEFTGEIGGELVLKGFPEIPHRLEIDPSWPLENTFIGARKINPNAHKMSLLWRDRHSMAWADISGDAQLDVFIGRGGIRGKLREISDNQSVSEATQDELLVFTGNQFEQAAGDRGLAKNGCPGRQSAWVDFNSDERLDLYVMCGRDIADTTTYPNQLYEQQPNGKFKEMAAEVGLDLPAAGAFVWTDANHDGQIDLVASQGKDLALYLNEGNRFSVRPLGEPLANVIIQLALGDADSDQDLDIYAVTYGNAKNKLFLNTENSYEFQDPELVSLPSTGFNGTWVDYDNDGLIDFHMVPAGLYQQKRDHTFEPTGILTQPWPLLNTWNGRAAWFDYDNNGTRDLLLAYQQTPSVLQPKPSLSKRIQNQLSKQDTARIWQSAFYQNTQAKHHWLELDVLGPPGNLNGIGAEVSVKTKQHSQFQSVGLSESARFSQGHYRLYFGLGDAKEAVVSVKWPGGKQQSTTVPGDQLITLEYPPAK